MLLGEFVQKLDAKNRFTLPARHRPRFADGVVVTKGLDGCLQVFNKAGWDSFAESWLQRLDPLSREGRLVSRFVFAGASESELDGQGRVMIPQPLMEHAGLSRDIVVAGVRDFLEVWDLDAWKRVQTESEGSVEDVTERLSQH